MFMASILPFIPLGVVGMITWSLWALRRLYGATYKPFQGSFSSTTSVIVPVYMEDPEVLLGLASALMDNNEHRLAAASLKRLVQLQPKHVKAWINLAVALSARKLSECETNCDRRAREETSLGSWNKTGYR